MFSSFLYLFKNRDFQFLKVLSSDVEFSLSENLFTSSFSAKQKNAVTITVFSTF
jgi:hypothetical protein